MAFFIVSHRPDFMDRFGKALTSVNDHNKFKEIAALFEADSDEKQAILGQSIARTWGLGGEYDVQKKRRELPEGVSDVSGFVDFLAKRSSKELKLVREVAKKIEEVGRRDPDLLNRLIELKYGQPGKKQ